MNLIEETNFAVRDLEAWKNGHGFSDRDKLKALADIWYDFQSKPENAKEIYMDMNSRMPKTDLGCGHCITDMLNFVYNWRKKLEGVVPMIDFKGVPQANIEVNVHAEKGEGVEIDVKTKVGTLEIDIDPKDEADALDPNAKFPRLKQIASRLHVKFTPKVGKEALKELIKAKIKEIRERK